MIATATDSTSVPAAHPTTPNTEGTVHVTAKDLPLHCPTPEVSLWSSHPRVFLPIAAGGKAKCPYCGTEYVLDDA